jgi:glycerol-3-phosphate dehydrogenase
LGCDVLVVGGGVNGAGIARDLAGRGLSVVLCEKDDLASHTSSSSTKLIHGGLRYLEHYEFMLVRKALAEREVLLKNAPHIMWPLRFVMPHNPSMRPAWMIRAGLFLYDHLARREVLPGSSSINLRDDTAGVPLKPAFSKGFAYADGWVDDARLVVLNAQDAAQRGAQVFTRTACTRAERMDGQWQAELLPNDGAAFRVQARALVNAAGPWAARFLSDAVPSARSRGLRLVKGSHIVVRKMFEHDSAYIFQNADGRIIFAIPYENDFTLIGTTDVEHTAEIGAAKADANEIAYLCEQANQYFTRAIGPADVVWTYSGVRPLLDDGSDAASAVTRDYLLELDATAGAPLLNVWGGKITTYRKLAEEAADLVAAPLGNTAAAWTHRAPLPGGDFSERCTVSGNPAVDFVRLCVAYTKEFPAIASCLIHRLARAYGARAHEILTHVSTQKCEVAPGVPEAELRYLRNHEWARTGEDVLWRRSKLGLHLTAEECTKVEKWFDEHAH